MGYLPQAINQANGKKINDFRFFSEDGFSSRKVELTLQGDRVVEALFDFVSTEDKPIIIALFSDISDRKKREQETEVQKNKLEKLNTLMVDRELKMLELKNEIDRLKKS